MRSALFFVALATVLISTHAWERPKMEDLERRAKDAWGKHMHEAKHHLANLKGKIPDSLHTMMQNAMKMLEQRHVKNDVNNAMETMERDLMTKWRNMAATHGMQVRDKKALEALMKHMMFAQARHNMDVSTMMTTYSHHFAKEVAGKTHTTNDIKALADALNLLGHSYIRKYMEGAEAIMRKNGVNLSPEQLHQVLHHSAVEAMNGKDIMEAMMAAMQKMGVNTAELDAAVKEQLREHFEKLRVAGRAELQKVMTAHKIPMDFEKVVAAMKIKGMEMMKKMKEMKGSCPKSMMHKLMELSKKAFKNMKPEDHKKLMMKLHLMIRPAMDAHFHVIMKIFKKHKMGINHSVIHYTIYHKMKEETDDDRHDRHDHGWWRKKPVRLALMIGGGIFGVALLIALIIVIVHMVKGKRRGPMQRPIGAEEKSALPYSIMDEKSATKA